MIFNSSKLNYNESAMGDSLNINGIIESYTVAADNDISAGDFVSYISEQTIGESISISSTEYTSYNMSAVLLTDGRVFIAHNESSTGKYLCGTVCTVNDYDITIDGTTSLIGYTENTGNIIEAIALEDNKVFIAHSRGTSNYLYGLVCKVNSSGTGLITEGTDTLLTMDEESISGISITKLEDGRLFISHGLGSTYDLYATLVTINGLNIIRSGYQQILDNGQNKMKTNIVSLGGNKVFISYIYTTSSYLYGVVVDIDENGNFTIGTSRLIYDGASIYQMRTVKLDNNKMFIAYGVKSSDIYGVICSIQNYDFSIGDSVLLSEKSGAHLAMKKMGNNKIFIAYGASDTLYGIICSINESSINIEEQDIVLSNATYAANNIETLKLNDGKIFIGHCYGYNYSLNALIVSIGEIEEYSGSNIYGIAKSAGLENEQIEVCTVDNTNIKVEKPYQIYTGILTLSSSSYSISITGFDFIPEGFALSLTDTTTYHGIYDYNSLSGTTAYYNSSTTVTAYIDREDISVSKTMEKGLCRVASTSSSSANFCSGTWSYVVWGK